MKLLIAYLVYACLQPIITLGFKAYGVAEKVSVWAGLPENPLDYTPRRRRNIRWLREQK